MNTNHIITDRWSNDDSQQLYQRQWPDEPAIREQYLEGHQCGGCAFFAPFNYDWGLCCHASSRHHLETVFEHFTCPSMVNEGWGPHSFSEIDVDSLIGEETSGDDTAARHSNLPP